MKRVITTLIVAGIGGIILAGCGSSASEENPEIKTEPKDSVNKMNSASGAGGAGGGQAQKPVTE